SLRDSDESNVRHLLYPLIMLVKLRKHRSMNKVQHDDRTKLKWHIKPHKECQDFHTRHRYAQIEDNTADDESNGGPHKAQHRLLHYRGKLREWPQIEVEHQEHSSERCDVEHKSV